MTTARALRRFSFASLFTLIACGPGVAEPTADLLEIRSDDGALVQTARKTPAGTPYLEYLPATYGQGLHPVMIFLHGMGERGLDLALVTKHGPPKHLKNGNPMTFTWSDPSGAARTESFVVISPQLPTSKSLWPAAYVSEIIEHVLASYSGVDPNRVYLTGMSMGGIGTYSAATSGSSRVKDKLAAISVIAGKGTPSTACEISSRNLPVWAFHGDKDTVVTYTSGKAMIDAINGCVPAPSPAAIFTVYPGVAHNSWDRAYDPSHTYHSPNVYEWLLAQRLGGSPAPTPAPEPTPDPEPAPAPGRLVLSAAMLTNVSGLAQPSRLIDEQTLAGDPKASLGGAPTTVWQAGFSGLTYPLEAQLDLGRDYDLSDVYLFDRNGVGELSIEIGSPGHWTPLFVEPCDRYLTWKAHPVQARTRYLRLVLRAGSANVGELVLYGAPAPVTASRTVLVDFGGTGYLAAGNNFAGKAQAQGGSIGALVDVDGASTGLSMSVNGFTDANTNGTQAPSPDFAIEATRDSFFGHTSPWSGNPAAPQGVVTLSGLDPARRYTLTFYASRMNVTDNRETQYEVLGASSQVLYLQVANNTTQTVSATQVMPDGSGELTVLVTAGPNNTNSVGSFYLGAMKLVD